MSEARVILGTAGHIDHGKTALVRALTGIDTDRLPQERQRGITIDLGFAHLGLDELEIGIVDVPGHERFIRNMLAGASGIDVAMLVVAADDSVMPQTREHLAILRLLDVRHGLIVLSKTDLADPDWVELVGQELRELVAGTFLERAPIVPTSAVTGAGIDALRAALREVCGRVRQRGLERPFRMAIDRSFVLQGRGTVVTGSVWSGGLSVGDVVQWLPDGREVTVRGLQSHGSDTQRIERGQRAAINLIGVHHQEIARGHELAAPGYLRPSRVLTVDVEVLEDTPWPLRHRSRARLHLGTQEVLVTVRLLRGTVVAPGERAPAQLYADGPAVATAGQPFVLRAESPVITIGGGHVLQPVARPIRRRDASAIERLAALRDDDDTTRLVAAIGGRVDGAWTTLDVCRDADLTPDRAAAALQELSARGDLVELDVGARRTIRVHRDALAVVEERIVAGLRALHAATPLGSRVARSALLQRLSYLDPRLVDGVAARMRGEERLAGDEQTLALPEFAPKLSAAQRRLRDGVVATFREAAFSPPERADVARSQGVDEKELQPILELCAGEGALRHVGGGIFLHEQWDDELRRRVHERLVGGDGITMADLRDLLGTSRKYAVPFGEYLDRIGVTRRVGDRRVLARLGRGGEGARA